jgi:CheY-like chemotaxis protein
MEARIVVIDNDESLQELFTTCLELDGRQVLSSSYDQINLAALEQYHPDLIILDFNLWDEGVGWNFLQLLKMNDATARIPILITTSTFFLSAEIQTYLSAYFIRVVHKPFKVAELLTLVQDTLKLAHQATLLFSSKGSLPVLVVDDNEELRDTCAHILRKRGYRVITASNGRVALEALAQTDYGLILLDIVMPIMNGYEFLSVYDRQLRPHSPVIIVSSESAIQTDALPVFVVDVLAKPVKLHHLLERVGKYAQPVRQ